MLHPHWNTQVRRLPAPQGQTPCGLATSRALGLAPQILKMHKSHIFKHVEALDGKSGEDSMFYALFYLEKDNGSSRGFLYVIQDVSGRTISCIGLSWECSQLWPQQGRLLSTRHVPSPW